MSTFEWPEAPAITYRLYYNDLGDPICYSMEQLPGKYIEVEREIFVTTPFNVKVVEGQLKILPPKVQVNKLVPSADTGTACHINNVCVIVDLDQPHTKWTKNTYETN